MMTLTVTGGRWYKAFNIKDVFKVTFMAYLINKVIIYTYKYLFSTKMKHKYTFEVKLLMIGI